MPSTAWSTSPAAASAPASPGSRAIDALPDDSEAHRPDFDTRGLKFTASPQAPAWIADLEEEHQSAELDAAGAGDQLECGGEESTWLRMWQQEEDEEGRPVTRTFGLPTTHVQYFSYNGGGNPAGNYRVGVFDREGIPSPPPPEKLAAS